MPIDCHSVSFVPVTEDHRNMLREWLSAPHAKEWWGTPEEELGLIYDGKGEHEPFIASINGEPVAYIQAWWPSQHASLPWQNGMSMTTRGIDITIGRAEDLGKGLGSLIVKQFSAKLFSEGASRLVIDPDCRNERAIAAYLKAGFTPFDTYETEDGADLLMELLPNDMSYADRMGDEN